MPHPPNSCLAQCALPSSYPRPPSPEIPASRLNSELFETGTKADLGAHEATATHRIFTHREAGPTLPGGSFFSPAPALETPGSSLF